ncbi:hypothetical protein TWF706_006695 [Orbilia oligospora]|nr:hypothetical protein TWF706_006695 [Orbilia oligospora]
MSAAKSISKVQSLYNIFSKNQRIIGEVSGLFEVSIPGVTIQEGRGIKGPGEANVTERHQPKLFVFHTQDEDGKRVFKL